MRAYWYDDKEVNPTPPRPYPLILPPPNQGDKRLPHDSGSPVSESYLHALGVIYKHCPSISAVDALATERAYKNRDEITVSPAKMGAVYEEKLRMFVQEHLHEDEEIRYILDGSGYFDVRSEGDDRWVRIGLEKEDLLILPAGIWHRFTTDEGDVRFPRTYSVC